MGVPSLFFMRVSKLIKLCVFFILCFSQVLQAQVDFEATVSKSKMGINDRFLLEIRVTAKGEVDKLDFGQLFPPAFSDFYLVGGPSTGRQFSMINGYQVISKTYSYALKPKKNGTFRIESASIEVGGAKYETKPIEIQVGDAFADQDPVKKDVAQDVFIKAKISNVRPYIGEQVLLTYDLYFSKNIEGLNQESIPTFSGFWNQEIEGAQKRRPVQLQYKGRSFSKLTLKKFILIPQKIGKLKVDPLVLTCKVAVPTERVDFWMQRVYEYYNLTLKSRVYNLNIRPLPAAGKPENFSGAVGEFTFSFNLNKSKIEVHKPVDITLRVRGKGNLGLFDIPEPSLPTQLERYTPKSTSDIKMTESGVQGSIVSEHIFVPRANGIYQVEGLQFSYFDPKARKYKMIRKEGVKIEVFGEAGKNYRTSSSSTSTEGYTEETKSKKTKIDYITQDIRYIKTQASELTPIDMDRGIFKKIWIYILMFFPLALLLCFRFVFTGVKINLISRSKRASDRALQSLKMSKRKLSHNSNEEAYYEALQKLIYDYLSLRFGIQKYEFTERKIDQKLTDSKVSEESISEIRNILSQIDAARFNPFDSSSTDSLHDRIKNWIRSVAKNV